MDKLTSRLQPFRQVGHNANTNFEIFLREAIWRAIEYENKL